MTLRHQPHTAREFVTFATQDDHDRVAMIIMQLEMALALAKAKQLSLVCSNLEAALTEARKLHGKMLN